MPEKPDQKSWSVVGTRRPLTVMVRSCRSPA
jgi:hypothetical protein